MENRIKPRFEIGNVISLHFESPSAIGYNGILCRVSMVHWNERKSLWQYLCKSIYGTASVWANEEEMKFQAQRHVEPNYGPCTIEIGD